MEKLLHNKHLRETLYLPENVRKTLQEPFGQIFTDTSSLNKGMKLIAVGDVTTQVLHSAGFSPMLSIIDFVVERKNQEQSLQKLGIQSGEKILYAKNSPGTITPSLWKAIQKAIRHIEKAEKVVIIVDGEEDLAVLPALLLTREGYSICYGQPHQGMVVIPVTPTTKQRALTLLSSFAKQY